MLAAGCVGEADDTAAPAATEKGTVVLGVTPWGTELSSGNVMKIVFEKAGYDCELQIVDVGPVWQALASGDVDAFIGAWLPTCHAPYLEKYGDQIVEVRKNLIGTRCGLVVPAYVTIDSIEELNSEKEKFDGTIIGIEPGAGIMQGTEEAIEVYGLDYELQAGSEVGMLASIMKAYDDGDWVVVTGWSPHWKFSRWDLKYLDDPENIYGGEEYIVTFAREGLSEEKPGVYAILERFKWDAADMESVMYDIEEGMSEEEAARKWVDANPEKVDEWIGA